MVAVFLFLGFVAAPFFHATVKPSIISMSERSDVIVSGTVVGVDKPGDPNRKITIQVKEFYKGQGRLHVIKRITFSYERIGKGNIDFQKVKEEKTGHIIFLTFVPDPEANEAAQSFHLELADAWFGMEPVVRSLKVELKEIERKKAEAVKQE